MCIRDSIITVLITTLISACGQSPSLATPPPDEANAIATNTLATTVNIPEVSTSIPTLTESISSIETIASTPTNTPIPNIQPTDPQTASTATAEPLPSNEPEIKSATLDTNTASKTIEKVLQEMIPGSIELPDISYFANNKSDRFLVDFEDIIAGHPHVGQRSPKPHNDAQVYFSNSDERWLNASQPSDYPPIYAVADGIIQLSDPPNYPYFNVIDLSLIHI